MLVGWVVAWHQKAFEKRPDIRDTWEEIFLREDEDGKGGSEHWLPAFLAQRRSVSDERHRKPFQEADQDLDGEAFVKDSYSLNRDAPALLTSLDRAVCTIFATTYLDRFLTTVYHPEDAGHGPWFDMPSSPYPRWMKASLRGAGGA
jgi:hypothetical protein